MTIHTDDHAQDLAEIGWTTAFALQLDPTDRGRFVPARVMAVHRDCIAVRGPGIDTIVPPFKGASDDEESLATVGDWLLLDAGTSRPHRLLTRTSLFKRRAPGTARQVQLIAANVDTLLVVSSCNQDFNLARLERYLVLAAEARVMPVVVLTKSDLADAAEFVREAATLRPGLRVEAVDARDPLSVGVLRPCLEQGRTSALVGSSGVGKSTLINTLTGSDGIETQGIREDDARGRHTTTARQLHRLPTGGWLLDTPGMRELQLVDAQVGLSDVFADVAALAGTCRFRDCRHQREPGCAVLAAMKAGTLEAERVKRWRKLAAEEALNSRSLAERRANDRAFGKLARRALKEKRFRRGE